MANTIMSAKNSFQDGLIMDFSPDNTQATCMTSALNATLLTFNGNEMLLQNDMGNGRVETARLPEGYVPVGTCEFGDIIYVASYNPLTKKALIGCFPSPERNISSEEIHDNTKLVLLSSDFLEFNGTKPTGKLVATSVKKVLIETRKLNPGDKYIIYTNNTGTSNKLSNNADVLSDYGLGKHNIDHKYLKLHVVSIEDSGKITYLDTTTKWYDDYYIYDGKINISKGETDLDSYRNLILSEWSIFNTNTKVSGKLAILAELEMPESFSCSYDLEFTTVETVGNTTYRTYGIYLIPSHTGDVSPTYLYINKASFASGSNEVSYISYNDATVPYNTTVRNNTINAGDVYDEYGTRVYIGSVKLPYQLRLSKEKQWELINSKDFVYFLEVAPAREFGIMDHLTVPLKIDFNNIGTGDATLYDWRYYNSDNLSMLKFGIEAYPKPNHEVFEIAIQFFDNQGLAAEYLLNDKGSYSGSFTEYIGLNGNMPNSRLTNRNSIDNSLIFHKGSPVDKIIDGNYNNYVGEDSEGNIVEVTENYKGQIYLNDAGTLYSNLLYATKIIIKLRHSETKEEDKNPRIHYRWFWTNTMFNEYYYASKDFEELNFELILNGEAIFETTNEYIWKQKEHNNLSNDFNTGENYKTNSANLQYIGYGKEHNINMYINAGLLNDYGCFNLIKESDDTKDKTDISTIDLEIYLGESQIKYSIPENQYEFSVKEETLNNPSYLVLTDSTNNNEEEFGDDNKVKPIAETFSLYIEHPEILTEQNLNICDKFNIHFYGGEYTYNDDKLIPLKLTLDKCYYASDALKASVKLSMLALLFNKAYTLSNTLGTVLVPVYTPIVDSIEDLNALGIKKFDNSVKDNNLVTLAFEYAVALSHAENLFSGTKLYPNTYGIFNTADKDDDKWKFEGSDRLIDTTTNTDFLDTIWGNINPDIKLFFPVYFGGYGKDNSYGTKYYNAVAGSAKNYIPTSKWKWRVSGGTEERENSKITLGAFDIDGAGISGVTTTNSTSFLGMKYKNGMTIINNAFLDNTSDNKSLSLLSTNSPDYDNFAYLLYLLLTNTYHKNKKVLDLKISLKNFVRNGDYEIDLTKQVIIKLSCLDGENYRSDRNILLRNIDFKSYKSTVLDQMKESDLKPTDKNVNLRFISFANDQLLKIKVKSQPMSFFDNDVEAYIKRFGVLYPINDMAPNSFYVFQDGELVQYANGELRFPVDDVQKSLKHIFGLDVGDTPKLKGAKLQLTTVFSKEDLAYNSYIDYIVSYMKSYNVPTRYELSSSNEGELKKEEYINKMFDTFPDSIEGYSKLKIRSIIDETEKFFDKKYNNIPLFEVRKDGIWYLYVNVNILEPEFIQKRTGVTEQADGYIFSSHRFLSIFDYLNEFNTKSTQLLGSIFGIKDGGNDKNSAYTGFARDVLLDTYYLVV